MKHVILYTDGACSGNPGHGGWGAVLIYGEHRVEMSGYDPETTNNRMEMTAPIMALKRLNQPCEVDRYSDSAYLVNAFNQNWLAGWQSHNWIKSDKKPVLNRDLWEQLLELARVHQIRWHKVKGHSTNEINNRCDELATGEIQRHRDD